MDFPVEMLVAHEWISSIGGSENVFRELLKTFPDAHGVCLWNDVPEMFDRPIRQSRLATSPVRGNKQFSLPLMPWAWRQVDISGYDTVLASSHAFCHHLASRAVRQGAAGYAYVHTPARYVWSPEVEPRGRSLTARAGSLPLKRLDRRAADSRVSYAANSAYVRSRVRRAWDVDASVIYPPVDVERIISGGRWRDRLTADEERLFDRLPRAGYVLGASRLVTYKRLDCAISLGELLDVPVVIAGAGPDETLLREQAGNSSVPVHFTGRVTDAQLFALYQEALLFAFLAIEDFGIMPVECVAAGTPVIVNPVGGAAESMALSRGGASAAPDSPAALREAAEQALQIEMSEARQLVQHFSKGHFQRRIHKWVLNA